MPLDGTSRVSDFGEVDPKEAAQFLYALAAAGCGATGETFPHGLPSVVYDGLDRDGGRAAWLDVRVSYDGDWSPYFGRGSGHIPKEQQVSLGPVALLQRLQPVLKEDALSHRTAEEHRSDERYHFTLTAVHHSDHDTRQLREVVTWAFPAFAVAALAELDARLARDSAVTITLSDGGREI